jgi:23S rRNA (adenine-N6)-dimethyltransferase
VAARRARQARRPARARSQHFLRTRALAAELVAHAEVRPDELILDLGAGSGRLTEELAHRARHVLAVELDETLAGRLQGRWPNVDVVQGDAATLELPQEPFRVVANLPFDRTTAILRHLLEDPRIPLVRGDVIVEWGLAVKRALPWPSTLNDLLWGAWYSVRLARRLPRSSFDPRPAVDAGLLVFERRPTPLVPMRCSSCYRAFVAAGFRRGLQRAAPRRTLSRLGLAGRQPRELDAYEWAALFLRSGGRPS